MKNKRRDFLKITGMASLSIAGGSSLKNHASEVNTPNSANSITDFDRKIQSGVPLLVPIYFMFLMFGKSVFGALLVNSIYLILAAIIIYHLTAITTNRVFGLICLVFFILTPYLLEYGHHTYGEIPALFYFLSSLVILHRLALQLRNSSSKQSQSSANSYASIRKSKPAHARRRTHAI